MRIQKAAIPWYLRLLTTVFRKPIKRSLLRKSEPLQALKENDEEMIARFFGTRPDRS